MKVGVQPMFNIYTCIYIYLYLYIYIYSFKKMRITRNIDVYIQLYTIYVCLPVVPHKAVAEVSKIGNL